MYQVATFDPLLSMSNTHHHTVKFLEHEISNIELAPQRVHALLRATERARGARVAYLTAARQGGRGAGGLTHMQGRAVVEAFAAALERGSHSGAISGSLGLPPEAVTKLAGDVRRCGDSTLPRATFALPPHLPTCPPRLQPCAPRPAAPTCPGGHLCASHSARPRCGDFMSFTRFCLLLQPLLACQSKRLLQEHRAESSRERSPSLRSDDTAAPPQAGRAAGSADDLMPSGGLGPGVFRLAGSRWARVWEGCLTWLPWLPSLQRRRTADLDLNLPGDEDEDEDFAEFSEAGSPGRRNRPTLERSATINAAAFSSIFHDMRRVASRTNEKEALAAQMEHGASPVRRLAVRAQEASSSAASRLRLRSGDTNRASSI